jgi:hypothetical protein
VDRAEGLDKRCWRVLERREKSTSSDRKRRRRPPNVKEQIVVEKQYKDITLEKEHIVELSYQPSQCNHPYRLIVLRKKLLVEQGQILLCDDVRYEH